MTIGILVGLALVAMAYWLRRRSERQTQAREDALSKARLEHERHQQEMDTWSAMRATTEALNALERSMETSGPQRPPTNHNLSLVRLDARMRSIELALAQRIEAPPSKDNTDS